MKEKKNPKTKRSKHYEKPLHIKASFHDAIKALVSEPGSKLLKKKK